MKYYRSLALAAVLSGAIALPALAQTAPAGVTPDQAQTGAATPPAQTETGAMAKTDPANPIPDAGVKKTAPQPVHHRHRVKHRTHLKAV